MTCRLDDPHEEKERILEQIRNTLALTPEMFENPYVNQTATQALKHGSAWAIKRIENYFNIRKGKT